MSTTSTTHFDTEPNDDHEGVTERRSRRRAWSLIGIGAAIAIGSGAIATDLVLRDDDRIVKSFDGPVTSVSIDVSGGSVTIIGTDDSTANVTLDIESGLRGPSHHETLENGRLVIASNCPLGMFTPTCATEYRVEVPSDVDVQLHGGGANVDISGVGGTVDVAIDGGNVDLTYDVAPTASRLAPTAAASTSSSPTTATPSTESTPPPAGGRRTSTCAPTRPAIV